MATRIYVFEGGVLTASSLIQGEAVPANTKRIIRTAKLINTTGAPIACTVAIVDSASVAQPKISARTIAAGETYPCPELIGEGMLATARVFADGLSVNFSYTATDVTNA